MFKKTKRVFLDYASGTPTDKKVFKEMIPYFNKNFANASALYKEGIFNREKIDYARSVVAKICSVKSTEVIFTGSGTESANLGIVGVARAVKEKINSAGHQFRPHIITTNIEHVAVLESVKRLEKEGFDITILPVNEKGLITDMQVKENLRPETILVSVMMANNEIGTIMPVRQIGVLIQQYKKENNRSLHDYPYLYTDASQAGNYLSIAPSKYNVDLMTIDGSKIYGPKGVGVLIRKNYVPIQSILYGGSHEFGMRPGTENTPNIIGFAKALQIADEIRETEFARIYKLQKHFFQLLSEISNIQINGDIEKRLPNNINICISGINSEFAVIQLDQLGISCAAMTACKNLSGEASSYVVKAITPGCEKSSLRFSLGRPTKKSDIDFAVSQIKKIININKN